MANVIVKNPAVLSGEPVFRWTRVPFKALTDYLEGGESLDDFLEQYPSVTREAAVAALEKARQVPLTPPSPPPPPTSPAA